MTKDLTPPKPIDATRPLQCDHGHKAVPRPVHPAWRGHGWWQDWADDCPLCDGRPARIPYQPTKG